MGYPFLRSVDIQLIQALLSYAKGGAAKSLQSIRGILIAICSVSAMYAAVPERFILSCSQHCIVERIIRRYCKAAGKTC